MITSSLDKSALKIFLMILKSTEVLLLQFYTLNLKKSTPKATKSRSMYYS